MPDVDNDFFLSSHWVGTHAHGAGAQAEQPMSSTDRAASGVEPQSYTGRGLTAQKARAGSGSSTGWPIGRRVGGQQPTAEPPLPFPHAHPRSPPRPSAHPHTHVHTSTHGHTPTYMPTHLPPPSTTPLTPTQRGDLVYSARRAISDVTVLSWPLPQLHLPCPSESRVWAWVGVGHGGTRPTPMPLLHNALEPSWGLQSLASNPPQPPPRPHRRRLRRRILAGDAAGAHVPLRQGDAPPVPSGHALAWSTVSAMQRRR